MQQHDILRLPHLKPVNVFEFEDHYRIEAEDISAPNRCPTCNHQEFYKHGSQQQSYMDTPIHGKRVVLDVIRRRYRCKSCGKTVFGPLPDMDSKRTMTNRLREFVEYHCLYKTFAEIAREVGVDDKTIRHIFDDYIDRKKESVHIEAPEVLGIDELKIIGQYRAMLTNVDQLSLYDMLPTRNKADLINYFKSMPEKNKVKVLTMDLWSVYRQVAQDQFPGRMIVADRFHVVRMANDGIEKVRKAIRKDLPQKERVKLKDDRFVLLSRKDRLTNDALQKLEMWSQLHPHLGAAYAAKEAFHDIYNHATKEDAMKAAEEWEASIDPLIENAFREVKGALRSWWTEIFNYYDRPISNGYTESVNNLAKGMNRMGRGYSFEVIRARLLYDRDASAKTKKTIRKKVRRKVDTWGFFDSVDSSKAQYETVIEDHIIEYGPHIPTLVQKLNSGRFL